MIVAIAVLASSIAVVIDLQLHIGIFCALATGILSASDECEKNAAAAHSDNEHTSKNILQICISSIHITVVTGRLLLFQGKNNNDNNNTYTFVIISRFGTNPSVNKGSVAISEFKFVDAKVSEFIFVDVTSDIVNPLVPSSLGNVIKVDCIKDVCS